MKLISITLALFLATHSLGNEEEEENFRERLMTFIEEQSLSKESLESIWKPGDMPLEQYHTAEQGLQILLLRGAEDITFSEIYSNFSKELDEGFEINGEPYCYNLKPYKMVSITYERKEPISNPGTSKMLGIIDGKIYLMGAKKKS